MPDRYRIEILVSARRELLDLPNPARNRVAHAIGRLAVDPRPAGVRLLSGEGRTWRLRVGDYRVLYEVRDSELLVLVIRIGHRREAYRGR